MKAFTYTSGAARVIFGAGSLQHLEREVALLGATKALVLCTPEQVDTAQLVVDRLGDRVAALFSKAVMHVPIETAREARTWARELGADCAVAIGGGSTIGLGKAIALEAPAGTLPILAIPTTYAGSEMTPIYGLTEAGVKKTGKDTRVLPRTVIYDAELTLSLPVGLSMTSGLNALAHSAEGLYSQDGNPIMSLMAEEGIRALVQALPAIKAAPQDIEARTQAQYGAWLCGTVLGNVGMALHHKLCHTLGGTFNLPHAETHSVVLPHAIAYNAPAIPAALAAMRRALGNDDPARALFELGAQLGIPKSLGALGMPEDGIERAADLATQNAYWNPRPIERGAIVELLRRAWAGQPPA
ncbi:MAG: maleylacetate reductase [Pseudomonadota bacterium]